MSFLRFVTRCMFASPFVWEGLKAVRNPDGLAEHAEGFTQKTVPLVQRVVPAQYSSAVPDTPEAWVRLGGAAKLLGGVMFATGIGRRLGATLLIPAAILDVAIASPSRECSKEDRKKACNEALTKLALLGGAIIAARDLQGKPGMKWLAQQKSQQGAKTAADLRRSAAKLTGRAKRKAEKKARKLGIKL